MLAGSRFPADSAYTTAFAVTAGVALVAAVAAAVIPRPGREEPEEAAADGRALQVAA